MTRFCTYCKRFVDGKKSFHGVAFVLIIIFIWGPGAWIGFLAGTFSAYITGDPTLFALWLLWMSLPIIYVLHYLFRKTPRCPICNSPLNSRLPETQPVPGIKYQRKRTVLFAQIIFGGLGSIFTILGLLGTLTYRPSIWYSGPSPIVLTVIGLPLIAIAALLNTLHKKETIQLPPLTAEKAEETTPQHEIMYCRYCGASIPIDSVHCEKCGKQLKPTMEREIPRIPAKPAIVEIPEETEPFIPSEETEDLPLVPEHIRKTKRNKKWILLLVLVIVSIASVSVLMIYFKNGQDTHSPDITGSYHSFDASGGYMVIGDGTPNWGSVKGTISFWIRWNTVVGRLWGQHNNMELRIGGSNLKVDWGETGMLTSSTSFTAGKWYFIAIVWNENKDELSLYIGDQNNVPMVDASLSGWSSFVSTQGVEENNFLSSKGGVDPTKGRGADLRYYNTDRSGAQIQSDYQRELIGSESSLKSYFKFNNNFNDIGPNNDDGSAVGSYSFSSDTPFNIP